MVAEQVVQKHSGSPPATIGTAVLVEAEDGSYQVSCERADLAGSYQVAPIMNRANGSIGFPVYDAVGEVLRADDRRTFIIEARPRRLHQLNPVLQCHTGMSHCGLALNLNCSNINALAHGEISLHPLPPEPKLPQSVEVATITTCGSVSLPRSARHNRPPRGQSRAAAPLRRDAIARAWPMDAPVSTY